MKKLILIGVVAVVVLIGSWLLSSYNRLVVASENVDNQWAQVETQYQRRFDLIPNLVNTVKGAMVQEQTVFGDLARARENYSGAKSSNEKAAAAGEVEGALSRLLVIMENYPALRSIEAVTTLMAQLEGTENRVSVERSRFNDMVKSFNVMVKRFPLNLLANLYGYSEKIYFEAAPAAENAPTVDLNVTQ